MGRNNRIPKLRRHSTGQGYVQLSGRRFYCGQFDDPHAQLKADRLVAEWLADGRRLPRQPESITVIELITRFWDHAQSYYRDVEGNLTSEVACYRPVLRTLRRLYEDRAAASIGPSQLKTVRRQFIARGLARKTVNDYTSRIRRMFRWAAEEELIPAETYHALEVVRHLARGRGGARETERVMPVPQTEIDAVLPHLSEEARAMVQLQLLTAARPGEICQLRPCDVDTEGETWVYCPVRHKNRHRGRRREIDIGPQAQQILAPFLLRTQSEAKVFSYSRDSYRRHVQRWCQRTDTPRWCPQRLRHNAATAVRRRFGLEAAQLVLGHKNARVTEIYAEADRERARRIAKQIG